MPSQPSFTPSQPQVMRGFTLLELMVVLSLIGALAAVSLPGLNRLLGATTDRTQYQRVIGQLADLPSRAYVLGTGLTLDQSNWGQLLKDGRSAVSLPQGWTLTLAKPLVLSADGICNGTDGRLRSAQGLMWTIQIERATCQLRADPVAASR